jgi:hypothetical protein
VSMNIIRTRSKKGKRRDYWASDRGKYASYKSQAKQRGFSFDLTLSQFSGLRSKCCNYCGSKKLSGVDRVDSRLGYSLDNCVPCCGICNMMKGTLSVDKFMKVIDRIIRRYNVRKVLDSIDK